jgi:hypothetical protein
MRGELSLVAASLLVLLSVELWKWQFPAMAAGEKLAWVITALRMKILLSCSALIRR